MINDSEISIGSTNKILANTTFTIYTKDLASHGAILFPDQSDFNNIEWLFLIFKERKYISLDTHRNEINICLISHNNSTKLILTADETGEVGYLLMKQTLSSL